MRERLLFSLFLCLLFAQVKSSCQSKLEHDRKELEHSHLRIVKQMEAKLYDLENTNKVSHHEDYSS